MTTPITFIDAKGGPAQIARDLAEVTGAEERRYTAGAIALWRHRNKIPRNAWPEIVVAYPEVTISYLREIEANACEGDSRQSQPRAS